MNGPINSKDHGHWPLAFPPHLFFPHADVGSTYFNQLMALHGIAAHADSAHQKAVSQSSWTLDANNQSLHQRRPGYTKLTTIQ